MQSSDCLRRYWLSTKYLIGLFQLVSVLSQLTTACGQVLIDIDLAVVVFGVMRLELSASPANTILQSLTRKWHHDDPRAVWAVAIPLMS